jgi:Arc/MetJ family transcription regulator
MGRTNVVIDEELISRVMSTYRLPTKRAAVDFALRSVLGSRERRHMLELEGIGWDGDLDELRRARPSDL